MTSGVVYYGSIRKAAAVLACVSACISSTRKDADKCGPGGKPILQQYIAELEEIEGDLVALLASARADANPPIRGDGFGSEGQSGGDVHQL